MLIIEGTDCVGKTTLCNRLAEDLKMIYQHLGPPPPTWSDIDYVKLGSNNAVRDRYHLSELVYSHVNGRPVKIRESRLLHATLMLKHSAYVVCIVADEDLIRSRYNAHEELFDIETVLKCNTAFKLFGAPFVDQRIVCTQDKPFPTEEDIDLICTNYLMRKKYLEEWKDTVKSSA
jgi:hypothetical protein